MSVASTSNVLVRILGEDLLTPAVGTASASMSKLDQVNKQVTSSSSQLAAAEKYGVNLTSNASVAFGIAKVAANDFGNAINHAKGFVSNLVSGPLGMIGLGAAAFSVAGTMKSGIDTANQLAATLEKLHAITGLSDESLSALVAVTDKYGISQQQLITTASFAEKTIGKLNETMTKGKDPVSKLTQLDKLYGITLVDNTGHAVDFQTELLRVADYYTSNATAAQKAALAAQLFGRGYQAMIPILALGSKGIKDAEQAAAALGLTLNATNVQDLQKYQAAMRDASEAVGGLKLALAVQLIPTLTDLARHFTAFVSDHRNDISAFFKSAIDTAKQVGAALMSVGRLAASAWNAIPGPLQTLLLQALIGNKVIKTVFGINIIGSVEGAVADVGKKLLGGLIGNLFGKTIATPVVNVDGAVVNVGGGVPGGGGGEPLSPIGVGGAAGGAGEVISKLGPGGEVGILAKLTPVAIGVAVATAEQPMFQQGMALLNAKIAAANAAGAAQITGNAQKIGNSQLGAASLLVNIEKSAWTIQHAIMAKLVGATVDQTNKVEKSAQLSMILSREQHKVTYAQLVKDAHMAHEDHLSELGVAQKQFTKAAGILTSSESTHKKIIDLTAIQKLFSIRGDTASAAKITQDILALLPPLNSIAGEITAIAGQKVVVQHDVTEYPPKPSPHRSNTQAAKTATRYGKVLGL